MKPKKKASLKLAFSILACGFVSHDLPTENLLRGLGGDRVNFLWISLNYGFRIVRPFLFSLGLKASSKSKIDLLMTVMMWRWRNAHQSFSRCPLRAFFCTRGGLSGAIEISSFRACLTCFWPWLARYWAKL